MSATPARRAPSRRGRLARVLIPLALVLGALVVAELLARGLARSARFTWRPLPPFGVGTIQREWLAQAEEDLAGRGKPTGYSRFDARLGWAPEPGWAARDGSVHVNAAGLRATREYAEPAPVGVRRVIACGESFTFGEEVADAEAWPARLEALEPGLEVLNYGVGGYGTDQALLRVASEARGPAEALLVGLMLENIGRNVNRYRPLWYPSAQPAAKPRYALGPEGLTLVPLPFLERAELVAAVRSGEVFARLAEHEYWDDGAPPAWLAWSVAARLVAGQRAYAAREIGPLWSDTEGEPFRTTVALLEAFRGVAHGLGDARLLVLVFPRKDDLVAFVADGARPWTTLLGALDAAGIAFLDLTEPLAAAAREGGVDGLYLASHFSPRANDLVARAVAVRLAGPREQK